MTEIKDKEKKEDGKKLTLGAKGTLSLKGNVGSQLRQNMGQPAGGFSVEVRRRRAPGASGETTGAQPAETLFSNEERESRAPALQNPMAEGARP